MTQKYNKIQVTGVSGSGKSTFARVFAAKRNLTYIEIDALYWQENWGEPTNDEFRADVLAAFKEASGEWVIDGTYGGKLGDTITSQVDCIVALDIPLLVAVPRVIRRSIGRMVRRELLWGKCRETPIGLYRLIKWMITTQSRKFETLKQLQETSDIEIHIFKSNKAAYAWLDSIK